MRTRASNPTRGVPAGSARARRGVVRGIVRWAGARRPAHARRLTRGDEVAEHAIRRVEHGDDGGPDRVLLGEVGPEETAWPLAALHLDRHDDDVGVEGAQRLD